MISTHLFFFLIFSKTADFTSFSIYVLYPCNNRIITKDYFGMTVDLSYLGWKRKPGKDLYEKLF